MNYYNRLQIEKDVTDRASEVYAEDILSNFSGDLNLDNVKSLLIKAFKCGMVFENPIKYYDTKTGYVWLYDEK